MARKILQGVWSSDKGVTGILFSGKLDENKLNWVFGWLGDLDIYLVKQLKEPILFQELCRCVLQFTILMTSGCTAICFNIPFPWLAEITHVFFIHSLVGIPLEYPVVDCSDQKLSEIPDQYPITTRSLLLGNNTITQLNLANLSDMKNLFILDLKRR